MKLLSYLKEKKLGLSIILLLYMFLIISLVFRHRIPSLYPISVFFVFLIFILSQYFDFGYKLFIIIAIILLMTCPFLLVYRFGRLAEYFANYVYGFLVLGIACYFLDNLREKVKRKGHFKVYKVVFLSLLVLILITPAIFFREYTTKTFNLVIQEYYRIFRKDIYYVHKDEAGVNGEIIRESIEIRMDYPEGVDEPGPSNVTGTFRLEGWAIDHNSSVEGSIIDMIEIFLDGKPGEGKLVAWTEPNVERLEIGEMYGKQHNNCGFRLYIDSLKFRNGKHTIFIYAHNQYFGWSSINFDIFVEN